MDTLPHFITDLAFISIIAGITTIIFKWLKQPVVLGYLLAGFIAGPHLGLINLTIDNESITTWARIGVIFLLFALGLEFSFRRFLNIWTTSSIATFINMGSMIAMGFLVGTALEWSYTDSIFLGGMLAISPTTIIIKALNDSGQQKTKFAGIVFGMLIVEDLVAIFMMIILSSLAVSKDFQGMDLATNLFRLVFFILIWFTSGIFIIPTFFKRLKKYLNSETLLIVSIGLCLGTVLFASYIGFSPALGAFIMGTILAETLESKHIEHLIEPLKNLFGAIFFVSVGMMIVPSILVEYALPILILTIIVLVGRATFATIGVCASGEGLKPALQAGFTLTPIGEFSFIIAALGITLGVTSHFLYPIIVAVSVITTFISPYLNKTSLPLYNVLEKKLSFKWPLLFEGYASTSRPKLNVQTERKKYLTKTLRTTLTFTVISLIIIILSQKFATPFIISNIKGIWGRIIATTLIILLVAPFMRSLLVKGNRSLLFRKLWNNKMDRSTLISLMVVRSIICIALTIIIASPIFPKETALFFIISLILISLFYFTKVFHHPSKKIEHHFLKNLNLKAHNPKEILINKQLEKLKNMHIEEFEILHNSPISGKTILESQIRQKTGVNIVAIIRGEQKIHIPDSHEIIFPYDILIIVGTDLQMSIFFDMVQDETIEDGVIAKYDIDLVQYLITEDSPCANKTISNLNVRRKTNCLIIGLERDNTSFNINNNTLLKVGDIIWITGEKENLKSFEAKIK